MTTIVLYVQEFDEIVFLCVTNKFSIAEWSPEAFYYASKFYADDILKNSPFIILGDL